MKHDKLGLLRKHLTPVRFRMRVQSAVCGAGIGVLAGCLLLLVCGVLRIVFAVQVGPVVGAVVVLASGIVGAVCGASFSGCGWASVARLVDKHYQLKDRIATALQFSELSQPSAFERLTLEDAQQHLQQLDAAAVLPFRLPKRWPWTLMMLLVCCRLWMAPIVGDEASQPVLNLLQTAEVVQDLQQEITDLQMLAEESANEELKQLAANLQQDLQQLKVPALTVRDSMKTVSDMQRKMQDMVLSLDVAAMDAELRNVGQAIAGAKPLKSAAAAIDAEDLDKAAAELQDVTAEELRPENLSAAERRPTAEKLAEAAKAAKDKGLDELSEQLTDLSKAIESGDAKQAAQNAKDLAQTIKQQSVNRKLSNVLKNTSDQLAISKQQMAVQSQSEGDGSMAGKGQNLKKGQTEKSKNDIASQKAGSKSAGNINGPQTQLDSQRQMARLTGQLGEDGDSETQTETTAAPDTAQQAERKAQEAFYRYQKMSEAVLDSESIPVGHRQTIRKYFELIRPTGDAVEAADPR